MTSRPSTTLIALFACSLIVGCNASASASANANLKSADTEEDVKWDSPAVSATGEGQQAPAQDLALLGARHDLRLAGQATTATCSCLAVAVSGANDPAVAWRSEVPRIDPASQLVIALGSDGLACPAAPKDSLGASYWGYKQVGNDVVVVVEAAREGRPITTGAIIPKPLGPGQVYVQPLSRTTPYGRPLSSGEHLCRIGNPGPPRGAAQPAAQPDAEPAE